MAENSHKEKYTLKNCFVGIDDVKSMVFTIHSVEMAGRIYHHASAFSIKAGSFAFIYNNHPSLTRCSKHPTFDFCLMIARSFLVVMIFGQISYLDCLVFLIFLGQ